MYSTCRVDSYYDTSTSCTVLCTVLVVSFLVVAAHAKDLCRQMMNIEVSCTLPLTCFQPVVVVVVVIETPFS
jgi:hypothetical protein